MAAKKSTASTGEKNTAKSKSASKKGLGKGLGSLIPMDEEEQVVEKIVEVPVEKVVEKIVEVPVEKIVEKIVEKPAQTTLRITEIEPNRGQPRRKFDEDALEDLADSIRQHGIIEPILVQKRDDHYEIVAGERRWRAAMKADLREVPVIIKDYSEQELFEVALIENIQRQDLNAIEEAQAYKRLIEEYHLKQEEVAERISKSRVAVTNSMRLLKLDTRVQEMVIDGRIQGGHARALLSIEDGDRQMEIAERVFDQKLSVRETESLIRSLKNKENTASTKKLPENDFVYRDYEEKLNKKLHTKVVIRNKSNNKGKIEIQYFLLLE